MSANWWEAAPLVNEPTPEPAKKKKEQNWWEEAPLLGEVTVAPEVAPVSPEQQSPIPFGPLGMLVESVRSMKAGAEGQQTVNPILGATSRGAELIGSALETTARLGEAAPEALTATGPAISAIKSVAPKLQEWADSFRNWGQEIDYAPSTKLGDIADNPATVVPFVVERVITSSPDMLAASVALPAYIPTRANEILNNRLKNDNRTLDEATIGDVAAAAAAATVEGTLERFATRQLGAPEGILRPTALQAGTEAVEEVGSYAGETVGTKEGFDPQTAALIGAEAAIVGGGLGGTIATGTELVRRNIESRVRDLEGVGTDIEKRELQRLRDQAFETAQTIAAPELPEVTTVQYGDAYAQKIYDSLGQYIPINAEFKVEEKVVDGASQFVVTDNTGIQYGQALDDKTKADSFALSLNNTTKERADLVKQLEPLQSSLKSVMKGFGLSDMGLTLNDRIFTRRGEALTSEGLFDPVVRRVFLAVDAIDPDGTLDTNQRREALRGVLRHEVVHALRYLDLWKRSEWKNLENAVGRLKKTGTDKTYLDIAKEAYGDQSEVIQVEEAVAEMIRDVADRQAKVAGRPRSLSERAINFFDKAKNALTGAGFQTYEDIVRRFEQGDIGARERGKIRTFRATEEQQAAKGEVPERLQRLFTNPEERNKFRDDTVQNLWGQTKPASPFAANALRTSGIRESRSIIDPVPEKIKVNEQEVPTRDSEGRLIYSGYEGPEVFGMQTVSTQDGLNNFWNWFGKSKAADKNNRPLVYYHGTAADITAFRPKQAGSVFITRSPAFAKTFSDLSGEYMIDNFTDFMSNQEVLNVLNESMRSSTTPKFYDKLEKIQKKASALIENEKPLSAGLLSDIKDLYQESGVSSKMVESIKSRMPSNANIVPVYVKAENPFDYENSDHIKKVLSKVKEISPVNLGADQIEALKKGDWTAVESPAILSAIKSLGFDSMYVEEMDEKNLAVFDPNQVKSAIGNNGQFGVTPSIRESRRFPAEATPEDTAMAEEYLNRTGELPYLSEGQLEPVVPVARQSIKKPYEAKDIAKGRENDPISGLPLNKDGTVTLYFPATNEVARRTIQDKRLRGATPESNRIYLTNESSGPRVMENPGNIDQPMDGANVMIHVDPSLIHFDQEFPDGRKDFFVQLAEGKSYADKMKQTRLFTLDAPRTRALSVDTKLVDLERSVTSSINNYLSLNAQDRKARLKQAREVLKREHNVGTLMGENGKLQKTRLGDYGLTYDGKSVASMGLGLASAQRINEQNLSTCPLSAICEGLCLGETSGQNQLYGGEGQFRSGPRLSQYLKTEALVQHPEDFAVVLYDEIAKFEKWANSERGMEQIENEVGEKVMQPKQVYQPAIRLNVTSDFRPQTFAAIIGAFPNIMFYDYTKLPTRSIAPNHHLTYSSTGASQVVNGETVVNPYSNWDKMVQRLNEGLNVAMAFTSRKDMPDFVVDERTGQRFQVWNGDNYDARFLDPKREDGIGMIVGLTNKDKTTKPEEAAKKYKGFFLDYDRARDGDTLVIKNQGRLRISAAPAAPAAPVAREARVRNPQLDTPEFQRFFKDSKAVDESGEPQVFYHGTTGDIDSFRAMPGHKLIFASSDPNFASRYAAKNMLFTLPPKEMQDVEWAERQISNAQLYLNQPDRTRAPNVIPLYVSAKNPFDYKNKLHIAKLKKELPSFLAKSTPSREAYSSKEIKDTLIGIEKGRWPYIEDVAESTDFFEKSGYDSVYVEEAGVRNLAVFNPNQLKSAVGNIGTFDITRPSIREARRRRPPGETPLGPTVPGPSTDSDTTAASEALNEGQPTNGLGMPTGPLVTDTMPDNTVDISRARLEPLTRRLIRTVEFFQSAPDKLRSGVGLTDIAKRIEDYYDTYAERLGVVNGIIREANKKISFGGKRGALDTFEAFIRARENGRIDEAAEILNNASESDRQLIDAWNQIAEETGRVNLSVRTPNGQPMKVYDPNLVTGTYGEGLGGFRPIRAVKQFFPRTLRREVLEVMMNSDKDPALYNELLDALIASGKVDTREEADGYLTKEWFSDEIKQDYFAGVEKARTDPLPEVFYDYSWDAATRYLRKWARRTSQIQYFGQEMGQFQKDWFDTNIPKVRDDETQEYLNEIKNRIYEIESFDFISNVGNWLNSLATATQLGNPISASVNLLGGTITNVQEFGIKEIAKSYANLLLDWKKVQEEGTRLGILNTDVMNVLSDHVEQDVQKYFSKTQRVSEALAKFTNVMLTFGGFNGAENVVRASAMLAARSWLNDSLIAVNQNPGSSKAKRFYEWVNRENLNAEQLILENGSGPETAKFMRRAVNVPQGSYKIDMTPVFADTTAGRFFLKYQKFGTQVNRFFYRHFLKPFIDNPTPTRFLRIAGFLGSAIVGGQAILAIREAFGYGDPGPDDEEIKKALENEDTSRAWALIFSRAWQNITAAGSMGNFGNYLQFSLDWQDQLRPKNPLSPPGLASIEAVADLFNRIRDQKSFGARDLDEIAENTLSFYRAYKRIGLASLEEIGSDAKVVKAFATRKEVREIRELSRRYSDEMEMEYKRRTAPGSIIRTPMTPINRKVIDALYAGDGVLAREIIREAQKGLPRKEREKIIRSIQSAVRNAQPIQIAGVAPSREIRKDFDLWARKNLPKEKVQLINRVDRNYKRASRLAGLKIGE